MGKGVEHMDDIMEQYGTSLLSLLAGVVLMIVFVSFLRDGGILHNIVQHYMTGICG